MADNKLIQSKLIEIVELHKAIQLIFSKEDVNSICFDLNIDYENFPDGKEARIRELIRHCERNQRLDELLKECQTRRPRFDWQVVLISDESTIRQAPYKGIQYFDESDAELFFGRENIVGELLDQIRTTSFTVLVGASGSGKSSLIRAGLLPILRGTKPAPTNFEPFKGSENWRFHVFTPTDDPIRALSLNLAGDSDSVITISSLIDDIQADPRTLDLFIRSNLLKSKGINSFSDRILIVIDQFEELFTLCKNESKRSAFIDNLVYSASSGPFGPTKIIIVLRADFYSYWTENPKLSTSKWLKQVNVSSMTKNELRRAIEEPAKIRNIQIQQGLVDVLLKDVEDQPAALPLLSHALLETWKRREGQLLTLQGYRKSGGIEGALSQTADSVFAQFNKEEKGITRNIFLRLVEPREDMLEVRRLASVDELTPVESDQDTVREVLIKLSTFHLLSIESAKVQIAHEALIGNWERLRNWLEKDKESLYIQTRLIETAREWKNRDRDESYLVEGRQLRIFEDWLAANMDFASTLEIDFIKSSRDKEARKDEQRTYLAQIEQRNVIIKRRLVQAFIALVITLMIVLAALAIFRKSLFTPEWQIIKPILGGNTWNLLVTPDEPNFVFVGSSDNGVYRSEDGGFNWKIANTGIANNKVSNMVTDPRTSRIIYGNAGKDGVVMTLDYGDNWFQINNELPPEYVVTDLGVSQYPTITLYAATWGYGIWSTPVGEINWQQIPGNGLYSNNVRDIAILTDPPGGLLTSISQEGLFISYDSGRNWELIGFDEQDIIRVELFSWNEDIIFAQEESAGPYISSDKGATWKSISTSLNNEIPRSFSHISHNGSNYLYIGTRNGSVYRANGDVLPLYWESIWNNLPLALIRDISFLFDEKILISTSSGVFASEDMGKTWAVTGPEVQIVNSIIAHPKKSNHAERGLVVATESGVYQTLDIESEPWTTLNTGLNSIDAAELISSGDSKSIVHVLLSNGNLYRLSENGDSWGIIKAPNQERIILADQNNEYGFDKLYIATKNNGIFSSSSDRQEWIHLWDAPSTPTKLVADSGAIYVGTTENGIYKSVDSGNNWSAINKGITNPSINDFFVNGDKVYTATDGGILISDDGGKSWKNSNSGLRNLKIDAISVNPKYYNMIYAGSTSGLFLSVDDGNSWQSLDSGLKTRDVQDILALDDFIYISTSSGLYHLKHPITPVVIWYQMRSEN